jgi:predicted transcriptional regulator
MPKGPLWETTGESAGITKEQFEEYFRVKAIGYAIKIKRPKRYKRPLTLEEACVIERSPQSFRYLSAVPNVA